MAKRDEDGPAYQDKSWQGPRRGAGKKRVKRLQNRRPAATPRDHAPRQVGFGPMVVRAFLVAIMFTAAVSFLVWAAWRMPSPDPEEKPDLMDQFGDRFKPKK